MSATGPGLVVAAAEAVTEPDDETPQPAGAPGTAGERSKLTRHGLLHGLATSRKALAGAIILVLFAALALLAPVIAPGDPSLMTTLPGQPPSAEHLLGTTVKGQDVLALTLWGARLSLTVGVLVGLGATVIGVLVGLASAFFGRVVDDLLSLLTNIFLLIPGLPLLVILAAFLPPGAGTIVLVLILTGWAGSARVLRAQAMSLRGKDFVSASIVTGEKTWRIMLAEIMPNMASIVMTTVLSCVIFGIGAQAGLEFLGLGDSSAVSWGTNLFWASNDGALMTGRWWTFVPSGVAIALVAFALALINYGVDEVTNPRLRTERFRAARKKGAASSLSTPTPVED